MTAKLSVRDLEIITRWSGHDPAQVEGDPRLQEMGRLLIHDGLTEVYNRRYFLARLHAEVQERRAVVVAMLDMDGFKQLNDSLGHAGGDRVLQALAGLLQTGLPGAVVARLGGDEFALLFSGQPLESVSLAVEQFIRSLPEHWLRLGLATDLRFSAGIAAWPDDGADVDALMRAADKALYVAKRSGSRAALLARDLRAEMQRQDPGRSDSALLVGRHPVQEVLEQRLAEAESGRGGLLLLRGPAGAGKSLLLEEVARSAAAQGWRVARATPDRAAGSYCPLVQLLAESRPVHSHRQAGRCLKALVGAEGRICLLIDHLPEADLLSLFALRRLGGTLARRPILIVATAREAEQPADAWESFQAEGVAAGWLSVLEMGGLSEAEIGLVAERWLGAPMHPEGLAALHRHAGGNPLHAAVLLQVWNGTGDLVPAADGWNLRPEAGLVAGGTLRRALLRLIQQLPPEVRELVGLAAVLGIAFSRDALADLSGAGCTDLNAWIDRAVQARVLRPDGEQRLRFAHPLLREAAYDGLSPQTRRLAHRLIASSLEAERSAPAAELARHYGAAGMTVKAFQYHVAAGEQALAMHETNRARQHLQAAWKVLPISVDGAEFGRWYGRLALQLAITSRRSGDPQASAELCAKVLTHRSDLEPEQVVRLLLELGESAHRAGAIAQAEEAQREAAELAADGPSASLRLKAEVLGLRLAYLKAVRPEQIETVRRLIAEAERLGNRQMEGELLTLLAALVIQVGDKDEAAEWNRRAIPLLPIGSGADASIARMRAGLLAASTKAARHWFQEALLAAAAVGENQLQARLLMIIGNLERGAGNWRVARRYYEQALHLSGRQGSAVERARTVNELGLLLAWSGAAEEGIALIRSAADSAIALGDRITAVAARGRLAEALMEAGRHSEALEALKLVQEWLPPENIMAREQRIYRAEAYFRLGDLAAAEAEISDLRDWPLVPESAADRGFVMGATLRAAGKPAEALPWLDGAIALRGHPFVEAYRIARVHMERAMALQALGRAEEARRASLRGSQILRRLEAERQNP